MPLSRQLRSRKIAVVLAVAAIVLLVFLVSVGRTLSRKAGIQAPKDPLIERVEKSPMTPIRIQQDDDAPLRIIEAKVHEVSGVDYERITGEKTAAQQLAEKIRRQKRRRSRRAKNKMLADKHHQSEKKQNRQFRGDWE